MLWLGAVGQHWLAPVSSMHKKSGVWGVSGARDSVALLPEQLLDLVYLGQLIGHPLLEILQPR